MDPRLRMAYSRCVREVVRGSLPDLVNGLYDYLMIDLASITYGLRDPRAFLANVRLAIDYGNLKPSVVFVVDYSKPGHKAVTKSRIKWLGNFGPGLHPLRMGLLKSGPTDDNERDALVSQVVTQFT